MLWHHLFYRTFEYGDFVNSLGVLGKICVCLFLFVSGYGLTKQFDSIPQLDIKNSFKFVVIRLAKFYKSYWFVFFAVILTGVLFGYSFDEAYPNRNPIKCLLLDSIGIMGYSSYLSTWWFNKLILQLYLFFPFLYFFLRNKYLAIGSLLLIMGMEQFSIIDLFAVTEGGLTAFFLGMILAKYPLAIQNKKIFLLIAAVLIAILVYIRFQFPVIRFMLVDAFIAFAFAYFFSIIGTFYSFPVLRYLGKYATTMYFIHTLFLVLFKDRIYILQFPVLIFSGLLALSIIVSIVLDEIQERSGYNKLQIKFIDKLNTMFLK